MSGEEKAEVGYKNLYAWKLADELVIKVYGVSRGFPKEEIYGLTSQLRRAILSVAANIIEGYARNSKNEFKHFLSIALGSLAEARYYLEISVKLAFIPGSEMKEVLELAEKCGAVLWKLYRSESNHA